MSKRIQLALLALTTSCASISNLQTADTLGKGRVQGAVEVGVQSLGSGSVVAGTGIGGTYPHIDGAVRFGVTDSIDLGLRAGWSFLELQGKFLLTQPGDPNLAISVAPTFGGAYLGFGSGTTSGGVGVLNIALPVLIGFKFGANELVLGPRIQDWFFFGSSTGSGASINLLGAGASVGFAWRITEGFGLMPEVSAVMPFLGGASTGSSSATQGISTGALVFQFKVGIFFGKARPGGSLIEADDQRPQPMRQPVQPIGTQPMQPMEPMTPPPAPPPTPAP
jgi:hypothetical protein